MPYVNQTEYIPLCANNDNFVGNYDDIKEAINSVDIKIVCQTLNLCTIRLSNYIRGHDAMPPAAKNAITSAHMLLSHILGDRHDR